MDLHCAYQQGPEHETGHCTALRHVIQDLIDQGLVHLGQSSVTTNPLLAHTTHAVPSSTDDIHFINFIEFDYHIYMLSWDESKSEPIVSDGIYEVGGVTFGPWMPTPFILVPNVTPVQLTTTEPLIFPCYSVQTPFVLIPNIDEIHTLYVDDVYIPDIQYVIREDRVVRKQPLTAARPLEATSSHEELMRDDDEILRQLQSTQARISIWSLLTSSSTHRDASIRSLSQIRVKTTTTPEELIHMMTVGKATQIVFSDDDFPPNGLDHQSTQGSKLNGGN